MNLFLVSFDCDISFASIEQLILLSVFTFVSGGIGFVFVG